MYRMGGVFRLWSSARFLLALSAAWLAAIIGCDHRNGPQNPAGGYGTPRLAVLSPALGVILDDLGRAELAVGRHGFDVALDPALPVVGNEHGIDYEALLGADPTHVLMERGARGRPRRLVELAASRGWTIRARPMLSLNDVRGAILWLDGLTTDDPPSPRADELVARFDRAMRAPPEVGAALGRTLTLAWTDPVGVMGPGSFHYELVERLGGVGLPREGAAYISMTVEDVVRLAPDSLVVLAPGRRPDAWRELLGPLEGRGLRAEASGRVFVVTDEGALLPSTRLVGVAEELVSRVEAWRATSERGR
jgi:ABC-type Fe3+-hydroxamate transport system substrate-binding protein